MPRMILEEAKNGEANNVFLEITGVNQIFPKGNPLP